MSKRPEDDYDTIQEPTDWVTEALASIVVSVFLAGASYRWLIQDSLSPEMTAVFLLTVMAALATVFGVDKLKAVWRLRE